MSDLRELLERVEKASGADPTLDRDLALSLDPDDMLAFETPLPFTSSIDAALGLVERVLPQIGVTLHWEPTLNKHSASLFVGSDFYDSDIAPTAPLAIIRVLLRAKLADSPNE